jgi:hypothetical protein
MGVAKELVVPALVAVFWVIYYVRTLDAPMESVLFPKFLMVVMPLLAVMILVREYRNVRSQDTTAGTKALGKGGETPWSSMLRELEKPGIIVGSTAGYLVLFVLTNFLISTTVFLAVVMVLLKVPWTKAVIVAVAFAFTLYAVFGIGFEVQI